jgi:hypothetical protein
MEVLLKDVRGISNGAGVFETWDQALGEAIDLKEGINSLETLEVLDLCDNEIGYEGMG